MVEAAADRLPRETVEVVGGAGRLPSPMLVETGWEWEYGGGGSWLMVTPAVVLEGIPVPIATLMLVGVVDIGVAGFESEDKSAGIVGSAPAN